MTCNYYFNKFAYISQMPLMKNLHVADRCTYVFSAFVIKVPDDGSGELEHTACCCMALKCCV